ncbi:LysR family transcriptional regulator [Paraburkholderia sp. GAS42]|uniref:LysR family transcriptional regulator n=1 Tax=Paraburkholderia sp. GAS42 TaxID=3035135 RepID=UPI003D1C783E
MDRLQAMEVFTKVVEMNSFSRAAEALEMTPASATTIIKRLEAHLSVRLMHRTTRRLKLTPEGADYYERCARVLAEIEEGENAIVGFGKGPRGKLRVDMPASLGKLIVVPQIAGFRALYPDIDLMIGFSDRRVDLIQDGVDCAIRVGPLQDSTLIARNLGWLDVVTAASPVYLERHGVPRSLADLDGHSAVHYFSGRTGRTLDLNFVDEKEATEVKMRGNLAFNDAEAYVMAGVDGAGIVQPPRYMAHAHLLSGALVEILPGLRPRSKSVSAVYPHAKHLAPKVRVFVEWVAELFKQCPLLTGQGDMTQCLRDKPTTTETPTQGSLRVDRTVDLVL